MDMNLCICIDNARNAVQGRGEGKRGRKEGRKGEREGGRWMEGEGEREKDLSGRWGNSLPSGAHRISEDRGQSIRKEHVVIDAALEVVEQGTIVDEMPVVRLRRGESERNNMIPFNHELIKAL